MADNLTGENRFDADGATWTLAFTINSLIRLEDELDMSVAEIGQRLGRPMRLRFLRTVFWVGLLAHHPDMEEERAGALLGLVEGIDVAVLLLMAFAAAFPRPKEGAKGQARPRKRPRAGTGKSSSASGASTD